MYPDASRCCPAAQVAAAEQAELRAHMDEEIAWARDQALGVPGLQSECRAQVLPRHLTEFSALPPDCGTAASCSASIPAWLPVLAMW